MASSCLGNQEEDSHFFYAAAGKQSNPFDKRRKIKKLVMDGPGTGYGPAVSGPARCRERDSPGRRRGRRA